MVLSHLADLGLRSLTTFLSPITPDYHLSRERTEALMTFLWCATDLLMTLSTDYPRYLPTSYELIVITSDSYWFNSALSMRNPDLILTSLCALLMHSESIPRSYDSLWFVTFSYDALHAATDFINISHYSLLIHIQRLKHTLWMYLYPCHFNIMS